MPNKLGTAIESEQEKKIYYYGGVDALPYPRQKKSGQWDKFILEQNCREQ